MRLRFKTAPVAPLTGHIAESSSAANAVRRGTERVAKLVGQEPGALVLVSVVLAGKVRFALETELCDSVRNGVVETPIQCSELVIANGASRSNAKSVMAWQRSP